MSTALTIKDRLQSPELADQLRKALPKHITADRFARVAITALARNPKLAECDQISFFNSLLTLGQFGLEPDGRHAHLIPYGKTCSAIIDYKGLVDLVMRSGIVAYVHADLVCESDEFEYDRGQLVRHRIDFKKPRGSVYAVYALCRFKDGGEKCEVMHMDEVEAIRKRSKSAESGPWKTDYGEMAKKTVFRRLSKWLPLSPEFRDAVALEDEPIAASDPAPRVAFSAPKLEDVRVTAIRSMLEKNGLTEADLIASWNGLGGFQVETIGDLTTACIAFIESKMDIKEGKIVWKN